MRLLAVLLLAVAATALLAIFVVGHGALAGDPVFAFDDEHGVNSGDLVAVVLWLVVITGCGAWWRRARRR